MIQSPIHFVRNAQQGLVLFVALIALMVMSLAAVVLVRSVDTSTVIAGNLAFKQAATAAADAGVAAAIPWMVTIQIAQGSKDPWVDVTHAFNQDAAASGYYTSISSPVDLRAASTWTATTSRAGSGANFSSAGLDSSTGNTVRYIIQRMCREPNKVLSVANCLFSDASVANGSKRGRLSYEAGLGSGAANAGNPIYRITARVIGPKNSVSYIQAYAY